MVTNIVLVYDGQHFLLVCVYLFPSFENSKIDADGKLCPFVIGLQVKQVLKWHKGFNWL